MKSDPRKAEIAGVWFPNKGAELMAHTAIAELGIRLPDLSFWSVGQGSDAVRAEIGMPAGEAHPKPDKWARRRSKWMLWRGKNCWNPSEIVIDISGFAYGDHWGEAKARGRAGAAFRRGACVYLLPQAFGAFDDAELRAEMSKIVSNVRMIAARDAASKAHLDGLGTGRQIPLLPDITVSLDVAGRDIDLPTEPYGCLVVNRKSLGAELDEARLLALYARVTTLFEAQGVTPIIVLHEPVADGELSEALAHMTGAQVVGYEDARDIKRLISQARCVVTGRFHGLVSGLSSGVPSFAVSWSLKYQELLADYGCADALYAGDDATFLAGIETMLT